MLQIGQIARLGGVSSAARLPQEYQNRQPYQFENEPHICYRCGDMAGSSHITTAQSIMVYVLLVAGVFLSGCRSRHEGNISSSRPEPLYFSKNWRAEVGFSLEGKRSGRQDIFRSQNGSLVALLQADNSIFQSVSSDNGRSWTQARSIFSHKGEALPVFVSGRLLGVLTVDRVANGGQMYFHTQRGDGWRKSRRMRDTYWGNFHSLSFAVHTSDTFYCVWTDERQGNPDVYFSVSHDGGVIWNPNIRIDDDQSGQEQLSPLILSTPNGMLHALWEDNRDPVTLFDIYSSSSHDGGRSWSPAAKVNDDTTATWQVAASAAIDAQGNLYVAWMDYRDRGAHGDITTNIYFSRSEDHGATWSPNVRISEARYGHNVYPTLHGEPDGRLYCTWMNSEDNQQNDISFSYSPDGGRNWSLPARVNDDTQRASHYHKKIGWLGYDTEKKGVVGWTDWRSGVPEVYLAQALGQPDTGLAKRGPLENPAAKNQYIPLIVEQRRDTLFRDDFSDRSSSRWNVHSGVWVFKDQEYVGYGAREPSSFVGDASWNHYAFEGCFKLDEVAHQAAILYVRVNKTREGVMRYYRIYNFFRRGASVEYFDGRSLVRLADKPYSFQKDQWYKFRAVVEGNVLNYYIDDTLLLVSDGFTQLPQGRVGIGTGYSPTYFKDILVTKLEQPM